MYLRDDNNKNMRNHLLKYGVKKREKAKMFIYYLYHLKASFSSRLQVRLDVAWIQVSNAHQKPWSSEGPEFTETEYLNGRTAEFYYY